MRTFGVEEELLLVDAVTGEPKAIAADLLRRHGEANPWKSAPQLAPEMHQEMVELIARPQLRLSGLVAEIEDGRTFADTAARVADARAVALGTSPLAVVPHPTGEERYERMMSRYGALARASLTCGQHVHVSLESRSEGVAVLDRIRTWLPVLLALSANSPFCHGDDTGYASYRWAAWAQWPCAGPLDHFGSVGAYDEWERRMLATDVLLDRGMLYYDARLSSDHPTVEVRVPDVTLDPRAAAGMAAIVRGLVETASRDWRSGGDIDPVPTSAIRLATWQSALTGLSDTLVSPTSGEPDAAHRVVSALFSHIRPALVDAGDDDAVAELLDDLSTGGTGADRQRRVVAEGGSLADVVAMAAAATHAHREAAGRR